MSLGCQSSVSHPRSLVQGLYDSTSLWLQTLEKFTVLFGPGLSALKEICLHAEGKIDVTQGKDREFHLDLNVATL